MHGGRRRSFPVKGGSGALDRCSLHSGEAVSVVQGLVQAECITSKQLLTSGLDHLHRTLICGREAVGNFMNHVPCILAAKWCMKLMQSINLAQMARTVFRRYCLCYAALHCRCHCDCNQVSNCLRPMVTSSPCRRPATRHHTAHADVLLLQHALT